MYIKNNVCKILSESYKWRKNELLTTKIEDYKITLWVLIKSNTFYGVFAIFLSIFVPNLFAKDISAFVMTSLSIFIGLFISVLLLIFDKFIQYNQKYIEELKVNPDKANLKADYVKTRNFSRRFVFVLLETLIIAFVIILLLVIPLIFEKIFIKDITDYSFVTYQDITCSSSYIFIKNVLVLGLKSIIVILLMKFSYYLLFLFSSLGEYMKGVLYGKVNI